jgi:hypothetical protein
MSQSVQEFVRRSGVELQTPNSASNSNNNFARELERDVAMIQERKARESSVTQGQQFFRRPTRQLPRQVQFPRRLENSIVNNRTYGRFKQFENSNNNSPLNNEFDDVILNSKSEKMINNLLAEQRFSNNDKIDEINNKLLANENFVREFNGTSSTSDLQVSKLNPGMFNALVNKDFGQVHRLDLKSILLKSPLGKTPAGEGLYIDTTEIRGVYGQFKQGYSHTKEAGPQGDLNKNYNQVQIKLQVTNNIETKGATVSIFRNGKIRFSGGFVGVNIANQPEIIRRFVVEKYTLKEPFLSNDFEYNNLSGQFRINGIFKNMVNIAREKQQYGMTEASYEPEITPFLYIESNQHKFIITRNGNVQISGAKNPKALENAYIFGTEFVKRLDRNDEIQVTGVFNISLKAKKPKLKLKAKAKAKAKTKTKAKSTTTNKLSKIQLNALNIDLKACKRDMSKAELIEFARKVGVVNFRTKNENGSRAATMDEICERIKKKKGIRTVTYKNTNKGKNVNLTGINSRFKVGKVLCKNMKMKELIRITTVMKIVLTGKEKKNDLCKLIEKARNNIANKPVVKPLSPGALKQKEKNAKEISKNISQQMKINDIEIKRRLNENSIRNDLGKLYGSKWMNRYKPTLTQDVKMVQNKIRNISNTNKNKLGVPFKRTIDTIKKQLVSNWKMQRKRDLEKKYLNNKLNVNGVNANLKNAYRRAAVNYMMNLTNAKKKIDAEKMNRYKKRWLKTRANANNNARPKVGAKARINKM